MLENTFDTLLNEKLTGYGYVAKVGTYELVHINASLCRRVRSETEQWQGKKCYEVVHHYKKPCPFCKMNKVKQGESLTWNYYHEGIHAHFLVTDYLLDHNGEAYFMQTSHEITNQWNEITNLKAMAAADKVVIDCANTLLDGADSITELLEIILEFFQGDYAYIFERDVITHMTRLSYSVQSARNTTVTEEDFEKCYPYDENSTWSHDLQESEYIFLEASEVEHSSFPYRDTFFTTHENSNFLMAALAVNGHLIGVLGVNNLKINREYLALITTVTAFISNSLDMKYTHEDLETSVSHLENRNNLNQVILDCVTTLASDVKTKVAIKKLLSTVCGYYQGKGAFILRKRESSEQLFCKYYFVEEEDCHVERSSEIDDALFYQMLKTFSSEDEQVAYVADVEAQMRGQYPDWLVDYISSRKVTSYFLVPLKKGASIIGYIWVDAPRINLSEGSFLTTISAFVVNHVLKEELLKKLEQLSYSDSLTGLYNRNYFHHYLEHLEEVEQKNVGIIFADVNGLKKANDNFGHELGDILLRWSGQFFKKNIEGLVFRIGGDEFVCFMENVSEREFSEKVEIVKDKLAQYGDVHISMGVLWIEKAIAMEDKIKEVDKLMYVEKQKYYKEKGQDTRSVVEELKDFKRAIRQLEAHL